MPLDKSMIPEKPLGRDAAKLLAMAAMACNHAAHVFVITDKVLLALLQVIGWFTAPVMCWFLCEGWEKTSSRGRYALRMFIMAVLSQPFYILVVKTRNLNMLFTLLACMFLLYALENAGDIVLKLLALSVTACATSVMDWPFAAAGFVFIFYYGRKMRIPQWAQFLAAYASYVLLQAILGLQPFGLGPCAPFITGLPVLAAGFVIGLLYNNKRSRGPARLYKYFFYIFYPAHLAVLWVLSIIG